MRLYRQKAVCEREDAPFQNKIDMAVNEIKNFEPAPETHTHVLVDRWCHCKRVRKAAQSRSWRLSSGLKSNCVMRLDSASTSHQSAPLARRIITSWRHCRTDRHSIGSIRFVKCKVSECNYLVRECSRMKHNGLLSGGDGLNT